MATAALTEAMRQANLEKTGEVYLKDLPVLQPGYSNWREGLLSSLNRCAPKSARKERDECLKELNDPDASIRTLLATTYDTHGAYRIVPRRTHPSNDGFKTARMGSAATQSSLHSHIFSGYCRSFSGLLLLIVTHSRRSQLWFPLR